MGDELRGVGRSTLPLRDKPAHPGVVHSSHRQQRPRRIAQRIMTSSRVISLLFTCPRLLGTSGRQLARCPRPLSTMPFVSHSHDVDSYFRVLGGPTPWGSTDIRSPGTRLALLRLVVTWHPVNQHLSRHTLPISQVDYELDGNTNRELTLAPDRRIGAPVRRTGDPKQTHPSANVNEVAEQHVTGSHPPDSATGPRGEAGGPRAACRNSCREAGVKRIAWYFTLTSGFRPSQSPRPVSTRTLVE